jgi:hypothetical protein
MQLPDDGESQSASASFKKVKAPATQGLLF